MKKIVLIGGVAISLFASCCTEKKQSASRSKQKPEQTTREKVDAYTGPAVIIMMK